MLRLAAIFVAVVTVTASSGVALAAPTLTYQQIAALSPADQAAILDPLRASRPGETQYRFLSMWTERNARRTCESNGRGQREQNTDHAWSSGHTGSPTVALSQSASIATDRSRIGNARPAT